MIVIFDNEEDSKNDFLQKELTGKIIYEDKYLEQILRGITYEELDDQSAVFDSVSYLILKFVFYKF